MNDYSKTEMPSPDGSALRERRALSQALRRLRNNFKGAKARREATPTLLLHPFPEHKVAFVELSKTGCTSIKRSLGKFRGVAAEVSNDQLHRDFGYLHYTLSEFRRERVESYSG